MSDNIFVKLIENNSEEGSMDEHSHVNDICPVIHSSTYYEQEKDLQMYKDSDSDSDTSIANQTDSNKPQSPTPAKPVDTTKNNKKLNK